MPPALPPSVTACFEAHGIDRGIDLGSAQELLELVLGITLGDVDGLAAERSGLSEALFVEVADHHHGCAEQLRADRGREAHGTGARDVTVDPGPTPAEYAPWKPVGKMSESIVRSRIFSSA